MNPHPISFLDDLLLLVCMPSFFLYVAFSSLPALDFKDSSLYGNLVSSILLVIQGLSHIS